MYTDQKQQSAVQSLWSRVGVAATAHVSLCSLCYGYTSVLIHLLIGNFPTEGLLISNDHSGTRSARTNTFTAPENTEEGSCG